MCSRKLIPELRAEEAIADLVDLPLTRYTHEPLVGRAFELRQNLSVYDAVYVALAEALQANILTADKGLAAASTVETAKY